eukprot:CAMPEP_0173404852 /NCGR_PEP_ID=MMETSP1356-20130122/60444_1 /TAXON_ID=77927 ORGANISM="Hemiselmis virescens, Strain PCC157" /NCGR_SAMPLE_ID=MMETSP1356 /ASSEMBLY_ACC=CAM_ASM_000847 /LENGTH=279 /DNA_ID=CAMNT_0014365585 /DNA_START=127 /DNA_END=963 /DNA_ORIENTATION=+
MCNESAVHGPTLPEADGSRAGATPQMFGIEAFARPALFGPGGLMAWLSCCGQSRVGSDAKGMETEPREAEAPAPQVLLLASSDVLHTIRSPYVNVLLFDVRGNREFRTSHIEGALSVPWQQSSSARDAAPSRLPPELEEHPVLLSMLGRVTPGALGKAFTVDSSNAQTASPIGSIAIVYDSLGDSTDLLGPAATFANTLARSGLVPEVGRIAGGFCAFKELNACLYSESESDEAQGGGKGATLQVAMPGASPASSRPSSERLSRAHTPHTGDQPQWPAA